MADTNRDPQPFLVLSVLLDSSARPAAVTRSHGDAVERLGQAAAGHAIAGLELAELPIGPKAFMGLRHGLGLPPITVALYDIFPVASHLKPELRRIAGQFLAAEALWALEEQGVLGGAPPGEKFDLPRGWSKAPKDIREKLVEAGATDISEEAVRTFAAIKEAWDRSR